MYVSCNEMIIVLVQRLFIGSLGMLSDLNELIIFFREHKDALL